MAGDARPTAPLALRFAHLTRPPPVLELAGYTAVEVPEGGAEDAEADDRDDPAPAGPIQHRGRRLVRFLVLRLLATGAGEDLDGGDGKSGVDETAAYVAGALAPLLRLTLLIVLPAFCEGLHEPPDR